MSVKLLNLIGYTAHQSTFLAACWTARDRSTMKACIVHQALGSFIFVVYCSVCKDFVRQILVS